MRPTKFRTQYSPNKVDKTSMELLEQKWPTCWLYANLNNFILQTGIQLTNLDAVELLIYLRNKGINLKKGKATLYGIILFTERWNARDNRKVKCYYINNLTKKKELYQFAKLLSLGNVVMYARTAWWDFKKDRQDKVLNWTDYEKTDSWHAVNIWSDKANKRLIEYWSYGKSKYNILGVTYKAFLGLMKNSDIKKSVYFYKLI